MNNLTNFYAANNCWEIGFNMMGAAPSFLPGRAGVLKTPHLRKLPTEWESLKGESFQGLLMIYLYDIFIP